MTEHIAYKILSADEYGDLLHAGTFTGSPADVADGFIHLSTGEQVMGTLDRHFAGREGLMLVAVDLDLLAPALVRWEPSRGGQLFPHLYATLPMKAVVAACPVVRTETDGLRLPVSGNISGLAS
ncbi:DUF952 domain-containing protein [Komagataeibacter sp. FNDCF1]|uniref:DUF952 domain-containing protein n=1 Tax=Komagataeibacter sp. FNDCF1 TaxID=2878681 RepID=UPI001E333C7A|nr:DUF952 domain-containing protein [Komagataeibacter sp. FNDCF1]MCE2563677.1 DUF952 domain-containing protein [Komagataeibacter sp. FNDCF1]